MKIFGFIEVDGQAELVLKGDSALLPNRKPYFLPDDETVVAAYPCYVFRISRLGKNISPRFAHRYVDQVAAGLHIEDTGRLQAARAAGRPWTTAIAMDGSLPIGTLVPMSEGLELPEIEFQFADGRYQLTTPIVPIEEAIAEVSKHITIRQGDYLFLPAKGLAPFLPQEEQYIAAFIGGEENLFCKIK